MILVRVSGKTIYMTRGDSESIVVALRDLAGNIIPIVSGDIVYFTVKESIHTKDIILQKIVTSVEVDGTAVIEIESADTKELDFKVYVYDVQLSRANGKVTTIITPSRFIIEGEVTYE